MIQNSFPLHPTMAHDEKGPIIIPSDPPNFDNGQPQDGFRATANDPEGERRIRLLIEQAAPKNAALLNDLMSTEEAVQVFKNNAVRLRRIEKDLAAQIKVVREATIETSNQRITYTQRRESTLKKWYYILTRMRKTLMEKIEEDERLYHEKIAAQSQAEKRQQQLEQDKVAIEKEHATLSEQEKKHGAAHSAIDDLYDTIFDGPTPGFADEDDRERNFKKDKAEYDASVDILKAWYKTDKDIALLRSTVNRAIGETKKVENELLYSFFSSGDALMWMDRCSRLTEQASFVNSRSIEELPTPLENELINTHKLVTRHLNEAYGVASFLVNRGYGSVSEIAGANRAVFDELTLALDAQSEMSDHLKTYVFTAKEAVKLTSRTLEDSRQALQEIRQGAFEIVAGFGAAAPAYNECCDRAERFEDHAQGQCERIPDPIIDDSGLPPPPSYDSTARRASSRPIDSYSGINAYPGGQGIRVHPPQTDAERA